MSDQPFSLDPTPNPVPWKPDPQPQSRQRVLFAGMDCLPGQKDLFITDGEAKETTRTNTPGQP